MDASGVIANLPERFRPAYASIEALQAQPRYLGAFIFGSLARGEATDASDFDVKVITDADSTCTNINHPFVGGVKLDITFTVDPAADRFHGAGDQQGGSASR